MIHLVLSKLPLDEVPGRVAVATFFEDARPLKGSTGLVDWRLNGRLSDLILQGRIAGHFSESVIMPAQGRLAASDILLFGLGAQADISEKRFEDGFGIVIDKLALLKAREVVVSFGDFAKDFMGWRAILRSFMGAMSSKLGDRDDFQVVCAEDGKWISEARKRNMDFGPQVSLTYA